ncbi:MAG: hypothetical protein PF638_14200 [Candidatus Delongbacteria bacterium]|jgi:hypothetical protein|nr:hypothetical protein [Candidatus Delongbacteria bacterium]
MKQLIIFLTILISLTFISCDSDYSGEISDTFNVYYVVEGDSLTAYNIEFLVNSANDTITIGPLTGNFVSDTLNINHQATESDLYYIKLSRMFTPPVYDTLVVKVFKGLSEFDVDSLLIGSGEVELKGQF